MMSPFPRIGFLVKTFPKLSETFILQEVLELERQGVSLTIYALHPPPDAEVHEAVANIQAPVRYLTQEKAYALHETWETHHWLSQHRPEEYAKTLSLYQKTEEGFSELTLPLARKLALHLLQDRIDHLHAHFANEPTTVAELAHYLTGIPFSFTAHAKDIYLSPPGLLQRKIQAATFVLTCTHYNWEYLSRLAGTSRSIYAIYHGIDHTMFTLPPEKKPETLQPSILSIGRFRKKKGFLTLIRACHLLHTQGRPFQCTIVGYGPLQQEMETLIASLGLKEHISLIGKKTRQDLIQLYAQATVFALPCEIDDDGDRDGIPNVLLEAMAMQLPVVSTTVSGIPELIDHDIDGLLVEPQQPSALANVLGHLLDDPTLCRRLGKAARDKVSQKFCSRQATTQIKELFLKHLASQQTENAANLSSA